jgi:hypothetical protein
MKFWVAAACSVSTAIGAYIAVIVLSRYNDHWNEIVAITSKGPIEGAAFMQMHNTMLGDYGLMALAVGVCLIAVPLLLSVVVSKILEPRSPRASRSANGQQVEPAPSATRAQ